MKKLLCHHYPAQAVTTESKYCLNIQSPAKKYIRIIFKSSSIIHFLDLKVIGLKPYNNPAPDKFKGHGVP